MAKAATNGAISRTNGESMKLVSITIVNCVNGEECQLNLTGHTYMSGIVQRCSVWFRVPKDCIKLTLIGQTNKSLSGFKTVDELKLCNGSVVILEVSNKLKPLYDLEMRRIEECGEKIIEIVKCGHVKKLREFIHINRNSSIISSTCGSDLLNFKKFPGVDLEYAPPGNAFQPNALWTAFKTKNYACADMLMEKGANVNLQGTYSFLIHQLIERNDIEGIELLMKYGVDMTCRDCGNQTPLVWAHQICNKWVDGKPMVDTKNKSIIMNLMLKFLNIESSIEDLKLSESSMFGQKSDLE